MKKYTIKYILAAFVLILSVSSCFKEPKVQGYIGEGIRLQGFGHYVCRARRQGGFQHRVA